MQEVQGWRPSSLGNSDFLAIGELAASLAPGRDLQSDPWLFGRLTRTLDVRKLTLLSAAGELARCGPFAIDINIATILSPAFLRFDSVLPGHLRGDVILTLRAADILSGSVDFAFARNFARSRLYRLALADVTPRLLGLLDVAAAGIDLLHIPLTPALREADPAWRRLVAPGSSSGAHRDFSPERTALGNCTRLPPWIRGAIQPVSRAERGVVSTGCDLRARSPGWPTPASRRCASLVKTKCSVSSRGWPLTI